MGFLTRRTLIQTVVSQTPNWTISEKAGDRYRISPVGQPFPYSVIVRHHDKLASVAFQCWLPMTFPMDKPPAGLFARLMIRSFERVYGAWAMTLSYGVEAAPCLVARLPKEAVNPKLFNEVCTDLTSEVHAFMIELNDKFQYDIGRPARQGAYPGDSGSGVPARRDGGGLIQFFE